MKVFYGFLLTLFLFSAELSAQTYSGPAEGSVASGVITNTDNFQKISILPEPKERGIRNIYKSNDDQVIIPQRFTNSAETENYFSDPATGLNKLMYDTATAVLLKSFQGIGETSSIPPDPYIAAGPTHIMATVNSRFAIWDKEGNLIKQIDASTFLRPAYNLADPFDPKVLYDHFAKRWIMVWLHQNNSPQISYFFVSVSDDSIPTGNWYTWALPSNQNGNTVVSNWGDYQGVGFDDKALYITSNQFQFGGSFQYVKIRIIDKSQLYNNTAGPVTWNDIWNIRYPTGGPGNMVFNIRPSIMYDTSDDYYLLHAPNFSAGSDFMALYKISNPVTNPVLSGSIVPVNFSYPAPNANQLGGSTMLIEAGGSNVRNEPKFRQGHLWGVHNIRNAVSPSNSSIRYVKINVSNSSAVEDVAFGATNFWYSYPAIELDKDLNLAITYSRSATTEYMGAYFSYRINTDPPGLRGSQTLQTGKGNYVKDYGSGRNRWGDYMGIWLDPSDNYSMWMFTEYAAATNQWGTWTGKVRLVPFQGFYTYTSAQTLNFGNVEVNNASDTVSVTIANLGEQDLVISSIPQTEGDFLFLDNLSFPLTLNTYDSLTINFIFSPADTGLFIESYPVLTNDPEFTSLTLTGYSYRILPAVENIVYAVTGAQNNSLSLQINKTTGAGTVTGPAKITEVRSLSVNPKTNIIYGVSQDNYIVRYNAEKGDAYNLFYTNLADVYAVAFDTSGQMYCAQKTGELYTVDLAAQALIQISKAKINISDMAFHPATNELYASLYIVVGSNKDRIYKINTTNGDTVLVGRTGFSNVVNSLAFDNAGVLYGTTGLPNQLNTFFTINTDNGTGTLIGSTANKHITGIAIGKGNLVSVQNQQNVIPAEFSVRQNYPNPFNPSTVIEFSLPEASKVKVTIFNLLGETMDILLNSDQPAGTHKVRWDVSSKNLSSGIYFYEVKSTGISGNENSIIRKMVFVK